MLGPFVCLFYLDLFRFVDFILSIFLKEMAQLLRISKKLSGEWELEGVER